MNHSSERAAILRAICDDLPADAPRLVYADWLAENGRPERAEFVRCQVERPRLPEGDPRRVELFRREEELEARHRDEWLRGAPPWVKRCRYWRGLLVGGRAQLREFLDTADALRAAAGEVIEVIIQMSRLDRDANEMTALIRRLTGCPEMRVLFGLNLAHGSIDDSAANALARSKYLGHLSGLVLRDNPFGGRARRRLEERFGDRVKL